MRKIDRLTHNIRAFLTALATNVSPYGSVPIDYNGPSLSFSRRDKGGVWLTGGEVADYSRLLSGLTEALRDRPALGRKWAESTLQEAILSAIDPTGAQKTIPIADRVERAIRDMKQELAKPPLPWDVFVPIEGLKPPRGPRAVGGISLLSMDAKRFRRLARSARVLVPEFMVKEWTEAKAVAHVRLQGFDVSAVNVAAEELVTPVLDVLNFYADIAHFRDHPPRLYLPGEQPSGRDERLHLVQGQEATATASFQKVGALGTYDLARLDRPELKRAGAHKALELIGQDIHTPFEKRVIVALRWAGRAVAQRRREVALLFHVVALEALLMSPGVAQELSFRVRLRAAHLLGRTRTARQTVARQVARLYTLRSKIVHTGSFDVAEEEGRSAWSIVKNAIVMGIRHRTLRQFRTENEVEEWFDSRSL